MKIYFDTEFIDNGQTIDLISIGLVSEDGREYYAEIDDFDENKADDWIKENVLVHLTGEKKPKEQIALDIINFVGNSPEFWSYYSSYDWVALCQLYGRMLDIPDDWPMYCRDLQQAADMLGKTLPPQESGHHFALADAKWVKFAHTTIQPDLENLLTNSSDNTKPPSM